MTCEELRRAAPCLHELVQETGRKFHEAESWSLRDFDEMRAVPDRITDLEKTAAAMSPEEIAGITDGSSTWYHRHMDNLDDVRPGLAEIDKFLQDYFY